MSSPASALVTQRPAFVPRVIALEASGDELACFRSEADPEDDSVPLASDRTAPAARPRLVLRVPRHLGAGMVAMLTGAFCGLVIAAVASPLDRAPLGVGRLVISSEPAGAVVSIDGAARGVTPMSAVLAVGAHHVVVGNGPSARPRMLRVTPGGEAAVHVEFAAPVAAVVAGSSLARAVDAAVASEPARPAEPTAARPAPVALDAAPAAARTPVATPPAVRRLATGWLTVKAPFAVRVIHDGQDIGGSDDGRVSLPAGTTRVILVNEALEFRAEHEVTVGAHRTATLAIEAPLGVLHANAHPWADVWVDGRRAGDTPLGNFSVPIGEHEVLFRHPRLGEARQRVTVGARTPARVSVELQP